MSVKDYMPTNPLKLSGYEKFWTALLAGNSVQVPINLTLLLLSRTDEGFHPGIENLIASVGTFWIALFAASGALFATNSPPTEEKEPTE